MKIYLDIDETILDNTVSIGKDGFMSAREPVPYLKEFLQHVLKNHDVYWLSAHCDGDATVPVFYLSNIFPSDLIELIIRIKPTRWNIRKIEAINLDEEFLWFDDTLMDSEEKILREKGKLDSFVYVNIEKNPDYLKDYLNI